ncbi:MAG TPA: hypothetical protein VKD89_11990 [Candidatus Udaeobacter sp.]|nr:hypothetical protein [Candidatus Udaeobacter sp.]
MPGLRQANTCLEAIRSFVVLLKDESQNWHTPMWAAELEDVAPRRRNTTLYGRQEDFEGSPRVGRKGRPTVNWLASDAATVDAVLNQSRQWL